MPKAVSIVTSNLIYIEKDKLPPALINRLTRLAAFQNPEFYKAQAMRLPTFGKPRVIGCAEDYPKYIGLPRGCLDDIEELLKGLKVKLKMRDERYQGVTIDAVFNGELNPFQQAAVKALLAHDNGILSATTAFGKAVAATWIIAARKVNTLVLVHRK
ncbi:hypothetical protein [Desulfocucumis palustris]|uniref:hypothetical protein n=1 Tax=Desulfocucumis palustris TaxID=1898651 RepID=UPI000CE9E5D4|nr:hypothetical protein [Desulfocucumis palustris]